MLDRFAEFLARRKNPHCVACAAIEQWDGGLHVYVSRNEGFDAGDRAFLVALERRLLEMSGAISQATEAGHEAWTIMADGEARRVRLKLDF